MLSKREKEIVKMIKSFEKNQKETDWLEVLLSDEFDLNNMFARAMIRYLFIQQAWPYESDNEKFKFCLAKFFDDRGERDWNQEKYIAHTSALMKEAFKK